MDPAAIDPKSVTGAATFKCFIDAVAFAAEKHRDQRRKARPHPRMEVLFDTAYATRP